MVKQARYMAKQRFAGMWVHGYLGLLWRHECEVVGSSKRSILYLGKQVESYKVMIYAPPCLREVGAEGEDDRKASPPRVTTRAQKKETLEANNEHAFYYYGATHSSRQQTRQNRYDVCHFNSMA